MTSSAQEPIRIRIKAVPGASRDGVAGLLGDRLKVRISAAPEGGKANKAICEFIAKALDIKPAQVDVYKGHTNPEKTVQIVGCSLDTLSHAFDIDATTICF